METECSDPQANPVVSYIFFHSFIVISALILISMFIGAITIAMLGVLQTMNEDKAAKSKKKVHHVGHETEAEHEIMHQIELEKKKPHGIMKLHDEHAGKLLLNRQTVHRIKKTLSRALGREFEQSFVPMELAKLKSPWGKMYFRFGMFCRRFYMSAVFQNFIALVIVFAGVLVGLSTDGVVEENATIELTIVLIFVFECVVKIIGEIFDPLRFFDDNWNR